MYTLPDYFSLEADKIADVSTKCQTEDIVNRKDQVPWSIDIDKWPQHADHIIDWISLRRTTKTITYGNKTLHVSDDNIDHSLLKPLLQKIRGDLLTPSYINKS
jgi:hypothetical protein